MAGLAVFLRRRSMFQGVLGRALRDGDGVVRPRAPRLHPARPVAPDARWYSRDCDRWRVLPPEGRKSATCFATTGGPLTEYEFIEDARDAAAHVKRAHGLSLAPYKCGRCGRWHLAPVARPAVNAMCGCRDADGNPKKLYCSLSEAEMRADMASGSAHHPHRLAVYRCPERRGWHITTTVGGGDEDELDFHIEKFAEL